MKLRVTIDAQSFEVEVGDLSTRPILVTVEGDTFQVWPEENGRVEHPVEHAASVVEQAPVRPVKPAAGPAATAVKLASNGDSSKVVPAPIPGVIISISVKEGDTVAFGQELCMLEAMKMKNQIRANRAGKIGVVRVAAGEQVKHGQILIEFAD